MAKNLAQEIAFQISATMNAREMSKTELAERAGMGANNLSRIMSPDYGKQTINSLRRIAEALDVALIVRMVPFSQYIDWLSGTQRVDKGISPNALAVPSFQDEEKAGIFEEPTPSHYFPVFAREVPPTKNVTIPGAAGIGSGGPISVIPFRVLGEVPINLNIEKRA